MWHQRSNLTRSHGHRLSHKHIAVSSGLPSRKRLAFPISPVSPTACLGRVEATMREPSLTQGYLSGERGAEWPVRPACTAPGRVTDTPVEESVWFGWCVSSTTHLELPPLQISM